MTRHRPALRRSLALLTAATLGLCSLTAAADPRGITAPEPASFGQTGANLVYTPLTPCRLLDTRQPSVRGGKITGQTSRSFFAIGGPLDGDQGGDASDCGLSFEAQHEAIIINVTAVGPTQAGFMTAWPVGQERPLAATLSYEPGQNISNEVIVPINTSLSVAEFEIYSFRDIHVVADVVGYLSRPEKAALDCVELASNPIEIGGTTGNVSSPFCPSTHAATGGSCVATQELALITTRKAANVDRWFCSARRTQNGVGLLSAAVLCCATPGL